MPKIVHEGALDFTTEDSGAAVIAEICDDIFGHTFFRFQSWDTDCKHTEINQFIGRRVRITIETLD
jgi:hypothetical protein